MNKKRLKNQRLSHRCISRRLPAWLRPGYGRLRPDELATQRRVLLCSYALMLFILAFCGCAEMSGYSNESLFPKDVSSVCLEMFDNQSFRRGVEYKLSDALAKRIEAATPYKIISSKDRADTVISGQIVQVSELVLSVERETGRPLERDSHRIPQLFKNGQSLLSPGGFVLSLGTGRRECSLFHQVDIGFSRE